jgi:hypothetical protein
VRESRSLGSARGAVRKDGPYRDYQKGQEMVAGADRTAATPVRPLGLDERYRLRIRMRRAE